MNQNVIIITGAAGFLGSAIAVDLSRGHKVVALDRRQPTGDLLDAAPGTIWHQVDIADADAVDSIFGRTKDSLGRIDFVVHFAAFYHFGTDWHPEYERTNVQGTSNLLRSAAKTGVRRMIFASSVAAMRPAPAGEMLTERTPTADYIPYAKSKSIGEKMLREASGQLPGIVLRIGGAFSDWSELPPLSSLIRLWSGRSPLGRLVVGKGTTGIPYIHRDDVVRIVRTCMDNHEALDPHEVLLASQHGTVLHKDLFPVVRRAGANTAASGPIFIPIAMARIGLYIRRAFCCFSPEMPFERPWMLRYVDRPWVTDTTYTRRKLGFRATDGMGLLQRLPLILEHFKRDRSLWEHRNRIRYNEEYAYYSTEV